MDVSGTVLSVQQYRLKNEVLVKVSSRISRQNKSYELIGEAIRATSTYWFATDATRLFISSLIHRAQGILDQDKCLDNFDANNVVVTNKGEAKFRHVKIIEKIYQARRQMYTCIVNVIRGYFDGYQIPEDMQDLINLMSTQQKDLLYQISPALLLRHQRSDRYTRLYEYVKYKVGTFQKELILEKLLQLPWVLQWKSKVPQNNVLKETFDFIPGSYDLKRPTDEHNNPTTPWTEREQKLKLVELLLDFVRNGTAHRSQRKTKVDPDQFETIIMVFYLMLLPKLQEAVYDVAGKPALVYLGLA